MKLAERGDFKSPHGLMVKPATRDRHRVALCPDHELGWKRLSGPSGHRPGRDDAESHDERIGLRVLSHLPIRKSHHVQPCQSQSVHQMPGCRRRHEALRRTSDLTTGRQQSGGQYRFQFGVRDGFGDWIEHHRRLHRVDATKQEHKSLDRGRSWAFEICVNGEPKPPAPELERSRL
jgi:hypothetical protein